MQNQFLFNKLAPAHLRVFLGDEGLTQSEASHITNLVKEYLKTKEAVWNTTGAYDQVLKMDGENVQLTAYDKIDLVINSEWEGQYNSITAWLKEGIKAKDAILKLIFAANTNSFELDEDVLEQFEQTPMPQVLPTKLKFVDENDIIAEWSIKDRCEYLTLEQLAAGIGKKIHRGNVFANLREKLARMTPNELKELPQGDGVKTFVVKNEQVYTIDEVDEAFFILQEKHRGYEQRLNYLKAKVKNDINLKNTEIRSAMQKESAVNSASYQVQRDLYDKNMKAMQLAASTYNQELEKRRLALTNEVSKLKIVIPVALQPWLDEIKELRTKK